VSFWKTNSLNSQNVQLHKLSSLPTYKRSRTQLNLKLISK